MDAVEHRNLRRHRLEVTLAVRVGDVALASGHDDHGRMQSAEDLLVWLNEPAVPDADRGDARIGRRAVGHQSAARHPHRGDAARIDLLIEAAGPVGALLGNPVDGGDQRASRPSWRRRRGPARRRVQGLRLRARLPVHHLPVALAGHPLSARRPVRHRPVRRHLRARHRVRHFRQADRQPGSRSRVRRAPSGTSETSGRSWRNRLPPTPARRVSRYRGRPVDRWCGSPASGRAR